MTLASLIMCCSELDENKISGTIASGLFAWAGVSRQSHAYLSIGSNRLSGTISDRIEDLRSFYLLNLGQNLELSGTIPSKISALTKLQLL